MSTDIAATASQYLGFTIKRPGADTPVHVEDPAWARKRQRVYALEEQHNQIRDRSRGVSERRVALREQIVWAQQELNKLDVYQRNMTADEVTRWQQPRLERLRELEARDATLAQEYQRLSADLQALNALLPRLQAVVGLSTQGPTLRMDGKASR